MDLSAQLQNLLQEYSANLPLSGDEVDAILNEGKGQEGYSRKAQKEKLTEISNSRGKKREELKQKITVLGSEIYHKLIANGWEKYSYKSSPAFDSGHSDYNDPDEMLWFRGFKKGDISVKSEYVQFPSPFDPALVEAGLIEGI